MPLGLKNAFKYFETFVVGLLYIINSDANIKIHKFYLHFINFVTTIGILSDMDISSLQFIFCYFLVNKR